MRAGRAIREAQMHAAYGACAKCGHEVHEHHERGFGNPGHEVGVFPCDKCARAGYERAKS